MTNKTRIQAALRSVPGVLAASVNLPTQRVRVEFERQLLHTQQRVLPEPARRFAAGVCLFH